MQPTARSAGDALALLLIALLDPDEIQRFVVGLPNGEDFRRQIPRSGAGGAPLTLMVLAQGVASMVGPGDQEFFDALCAIRPRRVGEIRDVQRSFMRIVLRVGVDAALQPVAPAGVALYSATGRLTAEGLSQLQPDVLWLDGERTLVSDGLVTGTGAPACVWITQPADLAGMKDIPVITLSDRQAAGPLLERLAIAGTWADLAGLGVDASGPIEREVRQARPTHHRTRCASTRFTIRVGSGEASAHVIVDGIERQLRTLLPSPPPPILHDAASRFERRPDDGVLGAYLGAALTDLLLAGPIGGLLLQHLARADARAERTILALELAEPWTRYPWELLQDPVATGTLLAGRPETALIRVVPRGPASGRAPPQSAGVLVVGNADTAGVVEYVLPAGLEEALRERRWKAVCVLTPEDALLDRVLAARPHAIWLRAEPNALERLVSSLSLEGTAHIVTDGSDAPPDRMARVWGEACFEDGPTEATARARRILAERSSDPLGPARLVHVSALGAG